MKLKKWIGCFIYILWIQINLVCVKLSYFNDFTHYFLHSSLSSLSEGIFIYGKDSDLIFSNQ